MKKLLFVPLIVITLIMTSCAPTQTLKVVSRTTLVEPGEKTQIKIQGKPNTEYDIDVIYTTTISKAKGLENHITDSEGFTSWEWTVGSSTVPGKYDIIISGGKEKIVTQFEVTYR